MDKQELLAIEERASAATPGSWVNMTGCGDAFEGTVYACPDNDHFCQIAEAPEGDDRPRDMEFIAHAREDVLALVAEVRRRQAEQRELADTMSGLPSCNVVCLAGGRFEAVAAKRGRSSFAHGATPLEAVRALAKEWEGR